jgi:hypothetical protein
VAEARVQLFSGFPSADQIEFELTDKNGLNVVSPGNEYWVSSVLIDLSQREWTMVTSGKKKLVLFGRAHYDDIFGRRHESTWLYWYDSEKAGGFVSGPFSNDVT